MKKQTDLISRNLTALRQYHQYSQEEVAEKVGVTRQSVAKWESGETVPDILNCDALAELYDVSVDALIHHDQEESHMPIPPKGKHLFGTVKVGDRGQVVLPKRARDLFHIQSGTFTLSRSSPPLPLLPGSFTRTGTRNDTRIISGSFL